MKLRERDLGGEGKRIPAEAHRGGGGRRMVNEETTNGKVRWRTGLPIQYKAGKMRRKEGVLLGEKEQERGQSKSSSKLRVMWCGTKKKKEESKDVRGAYRKGGELKREKKTSTGWERRAEEKSTGGKYGMW